MTEKVVSNVWEFVTAQEIMDWAKEWQKNVPMSGLDWTVYVAEKINSKFAKLIDRVKRQREYLKDSMLAACAYQGADIPKSWIKENEPIYKAQNEGVDKTTDAVLELLKEFSTQNKEQSR